VNAAATAAARTPDGEASGHTELTPSKEESVPPMTTSPASASSADAVAAP
jgi:hypothetical protein